MRKPWSKSNLLNSIFFFIKLTILFFFYLWRLVLFNQPNSKKYYFLCIDKLIFLRVNLGYLDRPNYWPKLLDELTLVMTKLTRKWKSVQLNPSKPAWIGQVWFHLLKFDTCSSHACMFLIYEIYIQEKIYVILCGAHWDINERDN